MNAKDEFLRTTRGNVVIGAEISVNEYYDDDGIKSTLNPGYTQEEYENFLESINVIYDSGYGTQHLFGIIFCKDGIWYDRSEYDGSEGWDYNKYPDMIQTFGEKIMVTYERSKKLERIIEK